MCVFVWYLDVLQLSSVSTLKSASTADLKTKEWEPAAAQAFC